MIVYNKEVTENYTDKVDYNPENLSLCVNKLTETDSGIYQVYFFDGGSLSNSNHELLVQGECEGFFSHNVFILQDLA